MKKILKILPLASILLFSCGGEVNSSDIDSLSNSKSEDISSSSEVSSSELESSSENEISSSISNSIESSAISVGESSDMSSLESSSSEETSSKEESSNEQKDSTTLYMIGDSTCASYDFTKSNTSYYYQIQGFGKTIGDYFDESCNVVNLGVGGSSSKSFAVLEKSIKNYNTFKDNIKEGDYVIITFGHNDEKKTDVGTLADGSKDTEGSFKYYLYNNFIKVALEAGATPILGTPIARYDSKGNYDITSKYMHNMSEDATFYAGNYAQTIRDLALEEGLTLIDTTNLTGNALRKLTPEEAKNWYGQPAKNDYDATHVNAYGAQMIGYMMAKTLQYSDNKLGTYVKDNIVEPTKEEYLIPNPNYVEEEFASPGEGSWSKKWNTTNGWQGSAFGKVNTKANFNINDYTILENADGTVTLGENGNNPTKLNQSADSFVMYFKQVDKNATFTLEATAKIDSINDNNTKLNASAIGLMVRDDMYIDKYVDGLASNYAATGWFGLPFKDTPYTYHAWHRDNTTEISKSKTAKNSIEPKAGDTIDLKIVKNDTSIMTYYKLSTMSDYVLGESFDTDLSLTEVDNKYVYVGLFTVGSVYATFSNINFSSTVVD